MLKQLRATLRDRDMMGQIFRLAWPTMIEEFLYAAVQYADTAQVGALGAHASAAIGLTTTTMWLTHAPMSAAGMGVLSCISISMGARDEERARQAAMQSVLLTLSVGGVLMVIMLGLSPFLPRWLGGAPELLRDASLYLAIVCAPMLFRTAVSVFGAVLRATGNTKTPMLINALMNAVNILLNFLLISPTRKLTLGALRFTMPGAGLGVAGAAIATAASFVLGGTLMTLAVWKNSALGLRGQKLRLYPSVMRQCVRVGVPVCAQQMTTGFGHVVFTSLVARLGTVSMAAHAIATTAEEAFYVPGYGMQAAAATLAGFSAGEKNEKKLMQFSSAIMAVACCFMTLLGLLLFLFPDVLMRLFTKDAAVITQGASALRIVALSEPFFAILIIIEGVFNGVGDTRAPFLFALCTMWGIRLPSAYLCVNVFHLGLNAVWFCMIADNITRFLCMLLRYRSDRWKKRLSF